MPYVGRSSFLPILWFSLDISYKCVNALCRAFFISTVLFLYPKIKEETCVNALCRAFFISTTQTTTKNANTTSCVNALCRAFFISTRYGDGPERNTGLCQCPMSGVLHFYPDLWKPLILRGCRSQFCKPILHFTENR